MNGTTSVDDCAVGIWTIARPNNSIEIDTLHNDLLISVSAVQVFITIFGSFGNGLSLCVLLSEKSLQTIPNVYIGHMAALDMITCLTIIPSSVIQSLTGKRLDEKPCRVLGYIILLNMCGAIWTMALISINRYILIIKGKSLYHRVYSKKTVVVSLAGVWCLLLLIIVGVPEAGFGGMGYNEKFGLCFIKTYCLKTYVHIHIVAASTFIPAIIIVGCNYVRIIKKIVAVQRNLRRHTQPLSRRNSRRNSTRSLSTLHFYNETKLSADDSELSTPEKFLKVQLQVNSAGTTTTRCSHTNVERVGLFRALNEPAHVFNQQYRGSNADRTASDSNSISQARDESRIRANTFLSRLKPSKRRKEYLAITNMLTVFIVLCVCWSPVVFLYAIDMNGRQPASIYKVLVTFIYLNAAINAVLYGCMNQKYRKAQQRMLSKIFCHLAK